MQRASRHSTEPEVERQSSPPHGRLIERPPGDTPLDDVPCPAAVLDDRCVVVEVNQAWLHSDPGVASVGQNYVDGLQGVAREESSFVRVIGELLRSPPVRGRSVNGLTIRRCSSDTEHWIHVSPSTVERGGRLGWMVVHQDATALWQMMRRQQVTVRAATIVATPQEPRQRECLLATMLGEVLHANAAVLWTRGAGSLRAQLLEIPNRPRELPTSEHLRQIEAVMDGDAAEWLTLHDGTPCFAVPLAGGHRAALLYFARRPRFDDATLTLAARTLRPAVSLMAHARAARDRTPRESRPLFDSEGAEYPSLARQQRLHIERTLEICGYNVVRTARTLGIARSTLYERLKEYGITIGVRGA